MRKRRRCLTIARALVSKPDILILDDSASALDYATDAALRKASLVGAWCESCGLDNHGSYGFATTLPSGPLMGHCYEIEAIHPYRPKELKRIISKKIELIRHGFPHPSATICKALGVKEGAGEKWAFAEIDHSLWAIRLK